MKGCILITFVLLPFFASSQSNPDRGKKATLVLTNISLEEALTVLGISYSVQFSYSDDVVPTQSIINLNINDEELEPALVKLLSPFAIAYKITGRNRIILRKAASPLTQVIRGEVMDEGTRSPIAGATVMVTGTGPMTGSITDDAGIFRIDRVPVGRIDLLVTSVGYDQKKLTGILLGTGKELVIGVSLSGSVTPMNEVVITGVKNDGIPGDGMAVTSSRTFSVEDTKRFAGSMGDPARMASAFAGVTAASDENNALVVRGNSPRGVLWRVDGIEIPNPNHFATEGASSGVVSVLSPNVIEKSDFLTGAFPAQYGNALSAIFDINLRSGNNKRQEYSMQTGLLGLEVSAEGPLARNPLIKDHPSSYLVNYRYSTLSVLDRLGFELNEAGQYKDYQDLSFKINFPDTPVGAVSLFGIGGKSNSTRQDNSVFDNNRSDMGVVGLSFRRMQNEKTFLTGALSYSGTHISKYHEVTGFDAGPVAVDENYSKSYLRAQFSGRRKITDQYFAEAGAIISQLDYNFFLKTTNAGDGPYAVIVNFSKQERDRTYISQAFLYARQYFSQSVFAFYGFHFIDFALTNDRAFEPRAGFRWQIRRDRSLSAAYGKHSRIENLQYYLARDHRPGGAEVQINKDLGFTRADHLVLTLEQVVENHKVKAETYYQKLYNAPVQADPTAVYASINEDTGFITDSLINKGRGSNYGVELTVEKPFGNNFYYLVNGSLFQSRFSVDQQRERNTAYNGNYSIHFLAGKEVAIKNGASRFGLNVKLTSTGGRRYVPIDLARSIDEQRQVHDWEHAFEKKLPAYFRTDIQLVYRNNRPRNAMEWRLDIQNVTDHRNPGWYYYDLPSATIKLKRQIGLVPLLTFRIDF
jgi:hypothetical protein